MKAIKPFINRKSLSWKLISRFLLILILLLVIMEIFQYVTLERYLYSSKEQILDARFHNMDINTIKNIHTSKDVAENATKLINMTIDTNMSAAVIDANGNTIAGSSKSANAPYNPNDPLDLGRMVSKPIPIPKLSQNQYKALLKQAGTLEGYKLVKDEDNNLQIVGFRKIGNINSPVGLMQLSLSAKQVQDIVYKQVYIYITAAVLILIIGSFIGFQVFKYTLRPLYNMTETVEKINVGQLNKRLSIDSGQMEIDSLSSAFNNMLEGIEISFKKEQDIKDKMRQFVSDASHELRTPLTSIHGFVEVLLRGAAKNENQLDLALNTILIESDRLTKLVNELLLLNRLDQNIPQEMHMENLSKIVEEISPQLYILSGKRKVELELKENVNIFANKNQVKQVIFNLVQNAVRHTEENGGIITIATDYRTLELDTYAVLKVLDNGTGISKENIDKIFNRFFRSEAHRARKNGGYGLGLSIVKSIIDAHDGKIEVDSKLGEGTTFTIFFRQVEKNNK
jgi:two-component system OmpR family sensor kinase